MPNWVFNTVVVSGDTTALNELREHLNRPVVKNFPDSNFNHETNEWEHTPATQVYSNPVFAFWNVVAPTDLEAYYGEESGDSAYWWNIRNWGTKWDVAVIDGKEWSDTELELVDDESIMYRFHTAWSPVPEIFNILSSQYPSLEFDYEYEEEQGWGGHTVWHNGEIISHEEWDIPSSHADYVNLGREDSCNCQHEDDQEYWYVDCPRVEVGV